MRRNAKLTMFIIMFLLLGYPITITFAEEAWKIETDTDALGYVHKTASIKNSFGFRLAVIGKIKQPTCYLYVPSQYPAVSREGFYLLLQVDNNPVKRSMYVEKVGVGWSAAVIYPDNDLMRQLKQGHTIKIRYYGITGWKGDIPFTLKGSSKAITEALR